MPRTSFNVANRFADAGKSCCARTLPACARGEESFAENTCLALAILALANSFTALKLMATCEPVASNFAMDAARPFSGASNFSAFRLRLYSHLPISRAPATRLVCSCLHSRMNNPLMFTERLLTRPGSKACGSAAAEPKFLNSISSFLLSPGLKNRHGVMERELAGDGIPLMVAFCRCPVCIPGRQEGFIQTQKQLTRLRKACGRMALHHGRGNDRCMPMLGFRSVFLQYVSGDCMSMRKTGAGNPWVNSPWLKRMYLPDQGVSGWASGWCRWISLRWRLAAARFPYPFHAFRTGAAPTRLTCLEQERPSEPRSSF